MKLGRSTLLVLLGFSLAAIAQADAATRYFDLETHKWVELGPGGRSMRNPVPRETVKYEGPYSENTIVVSTSERRLYFVLPDGKALKYGIGVGRDGFTWSGTNRISRMEEWPGWTPPPAMRRRRPDLPAHMDGGPNNPLGARALYIGSTLYRIHGSNEPWSIGQAVSSGCIRMFNDDVIHLYGQVKVGMKVVVLN
jgi:lipoprotein-anchoring transpeptidase ErfK/SrfK